MNRLLPVLLLLLAACGTRGEGWDDPLGAIGPVSAGGRLAWLVPATGRVVTVDPAKGAVAHPVGAGARAIAAIDGGVAVLGGDGARPVLVTLALPSGTRRSIPLPGAYDRLAVAPGGVRAVLTYDPALPPAPGAPAARNTNEIAVVDLAAGSATAVALRTESLAPRGVVFSDAGDLAAVILDGAVALVDLTDPLLHVRIPLKLEGGTSLTPEEALFAPDGAFLFVRAKGSDDVLAVEVARAAGELGGSVNFLFLAGARGLADIHVLSGPGFERHVAALYRTSRMVALLDATGDESQNHVADLERTATGMVELGEGVLLLHAAPGHGGRLDDRYVAGWHPLTDRLDEDLLQGSFGVAPRVAGSAAYFAHESVEVAGRGSTAALTVVRVEDAGARIRVALTSVGLVDVPRATAVDPATGSLLLAVDVPREGSGAAPSENDDDEYEGTTGSVVEVGVAEEGAQLPIRGVVLDAGVRAVGVAGDWLWALHGAESGDVTFVPRTTLGRSGAHRHDGFLLSDALDRKEAP